MDPYAQKLSIMVQPHLKHLKLCDKERNVTLFVDGSVVSMSPENVCSKFDVKNPAVSCLLHYLATFDPETQLVVAMNTNESIYSMVIRRPE